MYVVFREGCSSPLADSALELAMECFSLQHADVTCSLWCQHGVASLSSFLLGFLCLETFGEASLDIMGWGRGSYLNRTE